MDSAQSRQVGKLTQCNSKETKDLDNDSWHNLLFLIVPLLHQFLPIKQKDTTTMNNWHMYKIIIRRASDIYINLYLNTCALCSSYWPQDVPSFNSTVVSQVNAHGRLNITHNFGPHGRSPRIKIPYVCIEAATVAHWNVVHGHLDYSGHKYISV